jgi:polygalacturonase
MPRRRNFQQPHRRNDRSLDRRANRFYTARFAAGYPSGPRGRIANPLFVGSNPTPASLPFAPKFSAPLILFALLSGCAHSTLNIRDYGATGDGKFLNTFAFKKAIAKCKTSGGGIVRVPPGIYLTAPIELLSSMTLHLDPGATIKFTDDPTDFPFVETRFEGLTTTAHRPCLWADGCRNIAITGAGIIDGSGARWWHPTLAKRPPLAQFRNCTNVKIEGVTFQNSPMWTLHLLYSDHIVVRNAKFLAPQKSPNTDGCDIDSCRDVLIENCFASDGDDAFCLKSGKNEDGRRINRPTENITIRHCKVEHAHGAVVIGSEMSGSIRHVLFEDIDCDSTDNGIRIKTMRGRGGVVEDVLAQNIRMKNVGNAFILTMRYQSSQPEPLSERTPLLHDIHLKNIFARDCKTAGIIEGLEEQPIENITLENLDITAAVPLRCEYGKNIIGIQSAR